MPLVAQTENNNVDMCIQSIELTNDQNATEEMVVKCMPEEFISTEPTILQDEETTQHNVEPYNTVVAERE
jgi:hypothetical protein